MLSGYVERVDFDVIEGWAADSQEPNEAISVSIEIDGRERATISCNLYRVDLSEARLFGNGRHGFKFDLVPSLCTASAHAIVVRFQPSNVVLGNGCHFLPIKRRDNALTPILVTAAGRSGTTILMARLSCSPSICVADAIPFEVRHLAYYSLAHKVLSHRGTLHESTNPDKLEGSGLFIGHNPFFTENYVHAIGGEDATKTFVEEILRPKLEDASKDIILAYYAAVARANNRPAARFFAEKSNNLEPGMRAFARALFPELIEILLIRDPRDMFCSHISYFSSDRDKAFADISDLTQQMPRIIDSQTPNTLVLKYEDLIQQPEDTNSEIAKFLGIAPIGPRALAAEAAIFNGHGTAESPAASIGRWRRQMSANDKKRCNSTWREFLKRFDYAME